MKQNGLKNYAAPLFSVRIFTDGEAVCTSGVTEEIAVEWDDSWDAAVNG